MATKKKKAPKHSNGGNGGGFVEEFTPDNVISLAGFWRPREKGESIEGLLIQKSDGDYFVMKVTKEVEVVSRDRNTGEELTRVAGEGREVGVSAWAGLRGLERKTGHWVKITCLGKERYTGHNGETLSRWKTAIQVSKQIQDPKLVYVAPMREARARRPFGAQRPAQAPEQVVGDDDIPF
jgi:hypothetical protein